MVTTAGSNKKMYKELFVRNCYLNSIKTEHNYILKVPFSPALLKGKLVLIFLDDPLPSFCFIMFIGKKMVTYAEQRLM